MELLFYSDLEEWNFVRRECFKIGEIPASNVVIIQRPLGPRWKRQPHQLISSRAGPPPPASTTFPGPSLTHNKSWVRQIRNARPVKLLPDPTAAC